MPSNSTVTFGNKSSTTFGNLTSNPPAFGGSGILNNTPLTNSQPSGILGSNTTGFPNPNLNFNNPSSTSSTIQKPSIPQAFSFGNSSENKPAFSLGKDSTSMGSQPAFSFGNTAPISNPEPQIPKTEAPAFSFKSSSTENTSTFGSNLFGSQNTNQSTSFASIATTTASSNLFGGSQTITTTANTGGFSFGGNTNTAVTTTASSSGFNFQAPPVTSTPSTGGFSFQSPAGGNGPFSFNSSAPQNQAASQAPISTGFSFAQSKPTESVKPFSFGGANTVTTTAQQTSTTNSSMFSFGSTTNQPATNNNPTSSFTFTSPSNQAPVFGSSSDVSASFNLKLPVNLNTAANSSSIFGQNQPASSNNIFGQAQNQTQNSTAPPPYQFGSSASQPQDSTQQSKPFAFGTQQNTASVFTSQSAPASNFNFQASSNAAVPSSNQQQQPSGIFNFNSATPANPFNAPQTNLFNMGAPSNQQRRPIRQATRRLK